MFLTLKPDETTEIRYFMIDVFRETHCFLRDLLNQIKGDHVATDNRTASRKPYGMHWKSSVSKTHKMFTIIVERTLLCC